MISLQLPWNRIGENKSRVLVKVFLKVFRYDSLAIRFNLFAPFHLPAISITNNAMILE